MINKKDLATMTFGKKKPIRTCVQCKTRFIQLSLLRLQYINSVLYKYKGFGRSFYICKNCQNEQKPARNLMIYCKVPKLKFDKFMQNLKEIITNE